jgi:HSP20 family protein
MTLIRWSPMRGMLGIQDEMNRLFNAFLSTVPEKAEKGALMWNPLVDIAETEEEIVVTAEFPGMAKSNIEITMQDNVLTLKGEKKQTSTEVKEKNYHRLERSFGSFERSFSLPVTIRQDKIKAAFKDGILTIHLPKSDEAKRQEVPITVE